jgi:hypothetical protein
VPTTAGGFHEPLMIEGDVSLRNIGINSPFSAAYASRTPEKSVPMARGNGARIMNIFAEGGQFICLQTHFFGSAVAVILNSLH